MLMNYPRAQRLMVEKQLDALFFRNGQNIAYATDFHNLSEGLPTRPFGAVIFADPGVPPLLVVPSVDFRLAKRDSHVHDVRAYVRAEMVSGADKDFYPDFFSAVQASFRERKATGIRLGYEEAFLPAPFLEQLRAALPNCSWVPASELIAQLRAVKSADEIAHLKRSAEINIKAHESFRDAIRIGATEQDLALAAKITMLREGAEKVAFIFIGRMTPEDSHNIFPTDVPLSERLRQGGMGRLYRGMNRFRALRTWGQRIEKEVYKALDEGSMAIGTYLTGRHASTNKALSL
jgi:Xaa-Pro aminopeptidase